ncbi:hypothetical protein SF23_08870 [Streptomyces sp. MBRL 10]|nr:hypothetical protein SF23_08870 [Streptomyces sp. MBRL 10]
MKTAEATRLATLIQFSRRGDPQYVGEALQQRGQEALDHTAGELHEQDRGEHGAAGVVRTAEPAL